MKNIQKGFGTVAVILSIGLTVALAVTGWLAYRAHHNRANHTSASASMQPNQSATTTSTPNQVSPQSFVQNVLAAVASDDDAKLSPYLSPAFTDFRQKNLEVKPCNGDATNPNFTSPKVLALFCGSLLQPAELHSVTPTVSDFRFKDGQIGKSVDYVINQTTGESGATYYTFKLLPRGASWQLNDYGDEFVDTHSAVPNPLLGIREMTE